MQFVRTEDLKPGMRLAKPIYNRDGVLLYDRDSKLSLPSITSIHNFGLFGIYILEPAEPLPPLSREDLAFEQHQTIYMFKLQEIFREIGRKKKPEQLPNLILDIQKNYGTLDHRVNFNQNLRSGDDFIYKHAISTAILTAMLASHSHIIARNQESLLCAALLYDFGIQKVPKQILEKGRQRTEADQQVIQQMLERSLSSLLFLREEFTFFPQALRIMQYYIYSRNPEHSMQLDPEMQMLSDILHIAVTFDEMTAMNLGQEPESELMAMKRLASSPEKYSKEVVNTLAKCIHIVPAGASVDLSNGEKGIILAENPDDHMHPLVLQISDNQLYDLSDPKISREIQIIDIMKTMDNRIQIDENTLKHFTSDSVIAATAKRFRERRKKK